LELIGEILILGFLISTLYALVAVGFTMIFGVANVLNLAHGAFAIMGGYVAVYAVRWLDTWLVQFLDNLLNLRGILPESIHNFVLSLVPVLPEIVGALIAVVVLAIYSPLIYLTLIRPIEDKPVVVLLATLLLGVIMEQVFFLVAGLNDQRLSPFIVGFFQAFSPDGSRFQGFPVEYNRILAAVVSIVLIGGLWLYITRAKAGKAILAVAMDRKGATLSGIPTQSVVIRVWAISGALAAIAGVFSASFLGVGPFADRALTVLAFSIVVLGGLGSIPGSLVAALIIGFAETIPVALASVVDPALAATLRSSQGVMSLMILVIFLIVRPQGLFGRPYH